MYKYVSHTCTAAVHSFYVRMATTAPERHPFLRQPARVALIDVRPPLDTNTLLNVHDALCHVVSLAHSVVGPSRLPLFSVIVLGNYPECILPLQPIAGNFARVLAALGELKALAKPAFGLSHSNSSKGCLLEGLQEAMAQFKCATTQGPKQGPKQVPSPSPMPNQVEVTLITGQSPGLVKEHLEKMVDQVQLEHLKKISVVCVSDPERMVVMAEPGEEGGSQPFPLTETSPSELGLSVMDVVTVDNDVITLETLFKGWLQDCGTDVEHLHILLPGGEGEGEEVIIKCDLQERVLNPSSMTLDHFTLQVTTPSPLGRDKGGASSPSPSPLPVYRLRGVGLVSSEGLCESVLFGLPLVARPTACWKLDWEDLLTNQQHFTTLAKLLRERGQVLLARYEPPLPLSTHHITSSHPHFVLLPSPSHTLLIKSVVVSELLLPVDLSSPMDMPTDEVLETMRGSLSRLEYHETYNPLLVHSRLYDSLCALPAKKNPLFKPGGGPRKKSLQNDTSYPSSLTGQAGTVRNLGLKRSLGGEHAQFPWQL